MGKDSQGFWQIGVGLQYTLRRPTKRAADKWDSARFSSLFLALSFLRLPSRVYARPLAANASRWCAKRSLAFLAG